MKPKMSSTDAVNVDGIQFDRNGLLGTGFYSKVYRGTYKNQSIAVKRILKSRVEQHPNKLKILQELRHPNFVKLLHFANDGDFNYFALELCNASLNQVFLNQDDPRKYKGPALPKPIDVFLQLACGLQYIHALKVIHGNIKPENIFISVKPTDRDEEVTIKWADFGLSREVGERGTMTMSGIKGTLLWFSPEVMEIMGTNLRIEESEGSIKSDVYAEGLVFGYILLKGRHIYGEDDFAIAANILQNNPVNMSEIHQKHFARNLIERMLTKSPDRRITSNEVVNQLQSIKIKLIKEEENLLRLCTEECPTTDLRNTIESLMQLGIDINVKNNKGWNALHVLCSKKSSPHLLDAIELLIEFGIDKNAKTDDGFNALHLLCYKNSSPHLIDAIKLLIELDIDKNAKTDDGFNALHILCSNNFSQQLTDAIQILIELGIDKDANDNKGSNALHILCSNNLSPHLIDALKLLIELGIDKNAKNNYGSNAFHLLCRNNLSPHLIDAIKLLIELDIDKNAKDNKGFNALHLLCSNNLSPHLIDAIKFLIEFGIDKNATTYAGFNALHLLCYKNSSPHLTDAIKLLIELGIYKGAKTDAGFNMLHLLCLGNSSPHLIDAIKLLIELGIDKNAKTNNGSNALDLLYSKKSSSHLTDAIKLLINLGVDVNAKGTYRKKPLDSFRNTTDEIPYGSIANMAGKLKYEEYEDEKFVEKEGKLPLLQGKSEVPIQDDNDANIKEKGKSNPLHFLCQNNSRSNLINEIKRLIDCGYNVNDKDKDGRNSLHYLCQYNSSPHLIDAIQLLVKLGIDVNAKNDDEKNAVHYLCENNSSPHLIDAMELLVKLGIDVNAKDDKGKNALHYLCRHKLSPHTIHAIKLLFQHGIEVNARDKEEKNAFHYLCGNNSTSNPIDAVKLLIVLGIDVHAKDMHRRTVLDYMKTHVDIDTFGYDRIGQIMVRIIQILEKKITTSSPTLKLVRSAYEKVNDKDGRNALHHLCQYNSSPHLTDAIELLVLLGIDVNVKDKYGRSALHYLCKNKSSSNLTDAIQLLVEFGINVNEKDEDKKNALHHLCENNSSPNLINIIQLLVDKGIDANAKDKYEMNALHYLCALNSSQHLPVAIQLLVALGIDVNEKDGDEKNAFHFLCQNHKLFKRTKNENLKSHVLRLLIRYGIQLHPGNKASPNVNQYFFKENDNYGEEFLNLLATEKLRLGWHKECPNCLQILSIERSRRVELQHHYMFTNCYVVFPLLMKHLEIWAKSNKKPGEPVLNMSNPAEWLRNKAEQYHQNETEKSYKDDLEVMAEVSEQLKNGSNSGDFNCDNYERYLRSMYSIAEMIDSKESMGQIKWSCLLPFDFRMDYENEEEPDIRRTKIEWDKTLFNWAHEETNTCYGTFMKEEGFPHPDEFSHRCHCEV
ncbi:serine/threonine-protein phosphatase 6 regulatory ankyrin repeat subunit A-like isoform X2 [Daphnia carinata]|uniref:serine/threonine-protein phosphatase 6 regulatory ankyrin repeat subunit A-like isoform X2 n=1 Tax=Daphnia carinata TaxID=120202 RepID=UPI00257FBF1A|nr:serine/threonine-protein phosphatase 6 regulatory ankyrin repeat subunit A-like isoform X2 [Daphnia carinata]